MSQKDFDLTCSTCKLSKDSSLFSKNKSSKTGFQLRCKTCVKAHYKVVSQTVKESVKAYQEFKSKDPEWILSERVRKRALQKRLYKANPEKFKLVAKRYKHKNKAAYANHQRIRGMAIKSMYNNLRESHKEAILNLYKFRDTLSTCSGEIWHVDHIIPLKGKNVCGLHVPWNLQVLRAKDNMAKHNKVIAFESEGW